ncbi:unnamed protein product [Cunninghamella echinulata]
MIFYLLRRFQTRTRSEIQFSEAFSNSLNITAFNNAISNIAPREIFYEAIFNMNKIMKNRRRHNNTALNHTEPSISCPMTSFTTDRVTINMLFVKPTYIEMLGSKEEIKALRNNKDLSNINTGIYPLDRDSNSLTEAKLNNSYTVTIGFGMRELVKLVDANGSRIDVPYTEENVFSQTNNSYQQMTLLKWERIIEINNRMITNMNEVYDGLLTHKVLTVEEYSECIRSYSRFHNRRQKNLNKTSKKVRKNYNARQRKKYNNQKNNGQNSTIIGYGDAQLPSTMSTLCTLPTVKFRKILARKALVLLLDEYKTSQICARCDNVLMDLRSGNIYRCNVHW